MSRMSTDIVRVFCECPVIVRKVRSVKPKNFHAAAMVSLPKKYKFQCPGYSTEIVRAIVRGESNSESYITGK